MSPEVAKIRHATPVTEALVRSVLAGYPPPWNVGLNFEENKRAYGWRMFELRHPLLTRLAALFVLGPRIAFARDAHGKFNNAERSKP